MYTIELTFYYDVSTLEYGKPFCMQFIINLPNFSLHVPQEKGLTYLSVVSRVTAM